MRVYNSDGSICDESWGYNSEHLNEPNEVNEQVVSTDIGTTEFWANVVDRFQQTQIPSLARTLLAPYTMKSPIGKAFNLTDDGDDTDIGLKLVSTTIEAKNIEPYRISISPEAIDDYSSMYRDPAQALANALRGFTNRKESEDTIALLSANAVDDGTLTISDRLNAETIMFELILKTQQSVLRMNSKHLRTYHCFAVVPYKYVASVMSTFAYQTASVTAAAQDLQAAKFGMITYYVNPVTTDTNVYVGLRHPTNRALCAGIFGDYQSQITTALDNSNGYLRAHIHRRYGMAMSPLHTNDDPMLCKFKIAGL